MIFQNNKPLPIDDLKEIVSRYLYDIGKFVYPTIKAAHDASACISCGCRVTEGSLHTDKQRNDYATSGVCPICNERIEREDEEIVRMSKE